MTVMILMNGLMGRAPYTVGATSTAVKTVTAVDPALKRTPQLILRTYVIRLKEMNLIMKIDQVNTTVMS